ncbi:allophanate hydrolase [Rhizomicrobium palustre]|uniref:Allophanate hydrolase n=1 Tax=Rhizomicrobium palustre TaxID=189966 RepID=A0A846N1Y7_9PROT|nr:allophanate hydrolase [Rhizomicrobium palustre]NIK89509.1 allophanate hydrolase [Rhizomicrobium palustre]
MQAITLAGLKATYAKGTRVSDVMAEVLRRIDSYKDPAVWISRASSEAVMARSAALDADPSARALSLFGVPFAVKDNIDCAGFPTTAGCPSFAYAPSENATVVEKLLAAGAILLGKTNLDQFATGLVGTRSPYGAPRSVYDTRYISGGSSSGSAVAVAAGLAAFALGTDTAGSGRVPAAFNNIVGLKPTRGRLSARGVVPACRSLDCVSIFANTVGDAAIIAAVAEGFDAADPFSRPMPAVLAPPDAFRFGVLPVASRDFLGDVGCAALYDAAIARLVSCGGTPVEFDYAPFRDAAELLYDGAWVAERTAAVGDFLDAHESGLDPVVKAIVASGRRFSAVDAFTGSYRLAECRNRADAEWEKMDLMLLPTAAVHYTLDEITADPIRRNSHLGRFTNWVNLLDASAIAVPAGFRDNGLPFGITLLAPAGGEVGLTNLAQRFHAASATGAGLSRTPVTVEPLSLLDKGVDLFVVGAHLSDMPLNKELRDLKARFVTAAQTAPDYELYALANTTPPKPGMVRAPSADAASIAGEVWRLTPEAFGRFVAKIPTPLGIGKIHLSDGSEVSGFLCEPIALQGARNITSFGGWRAFIASMTSI